MAGDEAKGLPTHRMDRPRLEVVISTVVVMALLVLVVLVVVLTTQRSAPGPSVAADPAVATTTTAAATPEAPLPTAVPPTRTPRKPKKPKIELPKGPPGLAAMDRTMAAKGLSRVPASQVRTISFVVSSFNLLGASHTQGAGRRGGFGSAEQRLGGQIDMLNAKHVSVAGLQEAQSPQIGGLLARTGGEWAAYPGLQLGPLGADNSIIWRTDDWRLVEARTTKIPYFGGSPRDMPHVLLESVSTGRRVWFGNYHNPADIGGNQARHRAEALAIEAELSHQLRADGTPVIMTGDMNDRAAFGCPFAAKSGMTSADGAYDDDGRCMLPRAVNVDWIWGTDDMAFTNYLADFASEHRHLSDHPMITSTVEVRGADHTDGCVSRITKKGPFYYCPGTSGPAGE